jgi:UDPglucose 6-dehydrogenase
MNDIANLCELVGADIQDVAKGMSFDERIGSKFLNAGIGFGGSCFSKDTKALECLARQHGYELRTVASSFLARVLGSTRIMSNKNILHE